ncbi:MAG: ParB N-terminal domain-containing protein [Treponema sp.]|jgi:ParB family chromosome partitioning protein|nr:ParB N-terminal domain-containing protein [Treponema sp.]
MHVLINDIKVKKRIRKDLGDLGSLADSMKRLGQISPIVITKRNVLVAGARRLEAARSLGWRTINCLIAADQDDLGRLELQIEENTQRKDFTLEELEEASRRLSRLKNPSWFMRIIRAIGRFFRRLFRLDD